MFCREQVARLDAVRETILSAGADIAAVGNGKVYWAQAFVEETNPGYPVYTDPSRRTYDAAGFTRGTLAVVGPSAILAAGRTLGRGFRQSATRGDARQIGGVLVVSRAGRLVYRHQEAHAGDLAPLDDVVAACRRAAEEG